jgi:uncharacterized membrane protein
VREVRGTATTSPATHQNPRGNLVSSTPSVPPPAEGPAASSPTGEGHAATGTSTGLDPKVSGLLTYILGWVTGLVFFLIEKEHREVRFHAAQSILLSVTLIGVYIALSIVAMVPFIGLLALLGYAAVGLGGFVLWVYLLVQGYNLNHVRLPVLGEFAERMAAS